VARQLVSPAADVPSTGVPRPRGLGIDWITATRLAARCGDLRRPQRFPLPIGKALSRAATVRARDLPVHREVGGNFATDFLPTNAARRANRVALAVSPGGLPGVVVDPVSTPQIGPCRAQLGDGRHAPRGSRRPSRGRRAAGRAAGATTQRASVRDSARRVMLDAARAHSCCCRGPRLRKGARPGRQPAAASGPLSQSSRGLTTPGIEPA
jgi:hypothetical protein